jgi:HSP20 family protein
MRNRFSNKGMAPFEEFMTGLNWDFPAVPARKLFHVDVKETDRGYVLYADLPGYRKEDIKVEYHNKNLLINAHRNTVIESESEKFILNERTSGEVYRSFYIEDIDEDQVQVHYEGGLLIIDLPKKSGGENTRKRFEVK